MRSDGSFFEGCFSEELLFGMCFCNDASKDVALDPPVELPRRRAHRKQSSRRRRRSDAAPPAPVEPPPLPQREVSFALFKRRRRRSKLPAIIQTELFAKRLGFSRFVQARSKWPGTPTTGRRRSYAREDDVGVH